MVALLNMVLRVGVGDGMPNGRKISEGVLRGLRCLLVDRCVSKIHEEKKK